MRAVQFEVLVDGIADRRRLDEATGQLAQDLRRIGGLAAGPLIDPAPPGSKSGTVQHIGGIVLSGLVSAAGLKAIADIAVAWLGRSGARQITVRNGDREVTITGASADDVERVVRDLDKLVG